MDGADEVGRFNGFNGFKSFRKLVVLFLMFVEPISNILASFIDEGRHLVHSAIQWIQMCFEGYGQPGRQTSPCKTRVSSRYLESVRFLGQGYSGYTYETTWSTWFGKQKAGRFARKDFPGVGEKVFENEVARLVNLVHPNLVKVFCWTVDRLGCSLVLEFVKNNLQSVVEKRKKLFLQSEKSAPGAASPLELIEAVYIMLKIATAMRYLHGEGIAHGDLRPNNVLVDLEAVPKIVKVVDFGLIESKKRTVLVSKRAQFLQTLEWKAPETCNAFHNSWQNTSDEYPWAEMDMEGSASVSVADEQADVYSFAITCAYILGGKVSFPKSSLTGLEGEILSGTWRPEIPFTCPMDLKKLIESSWNSDPNRRPTFLQLAKQLETLKQELVDGFFEAREFFTELINPNTTKKFHTAMMTFRESRPFFTVSMEFDKAKQQYRTTEFDKAKQQDDDFSKAREFFTELINPNTTKKFHTAMMTFRVSRRFCTVSMEFDEAKQQYRTTEFDKAKQQYSPTLMCEIDDTKAHSLSWSATDSGILEQNLETFESVKKKWGHFFLDNVDIRLGEKFAEGGQAELFYARWEGAVPDGIVLKVFKKRIPFEDLERSWNPEYLALVDQANKTGSWNAPRICHIFSGLMLPDGRFAFAMERYLGDLRALIDMRMRMNNYQGPPFKDLVAKRIILEIAEGIRDLHKLNIVHRDVKASNIFLKSLDDDDYPKASYIPIKPAQGTTAVEETLAPQVDSSGTSEEIHMDPKRTLFGWRDTNLFDHDYSTGNPKALPEDDAFSCVVGDFECSIGVVGTKFWRAPEILLALKKQQLNLNPEIFSRSIDVYSYSMTCFEILTGRMPFEGEELLRTYDRVVTDGLRPELPAEIDPAVRTLVSRCWDQDPMARPTCEEIVEVLEAMTNVKDMDEH